jgi:hypothetical protein
MTFQEYYLSLPPSGRSKYCDDIELDQRYVELHLLKVQRRNPREKTMERMAKKSKGHLSYLDVLTSFPKINTKQPDHAS